VSLSRITAVRELVHIMIQSGLQRFSVSDEPHSDIVRTSLLTDRVCSVDYSRIQSPLNDIGRARARSLVLAFPNLMDLKETTVQGIESIPSVLDATLGKAFGTAAKPFAGALSRALAGR
jgi:hypothetical protein